MWEISTLPANESFSIKKRRILIKREIMNVIKLSDEMKISKTNTPNSSKYRELYSLS